MGRGNQYLQLIKVLCYKLPTNGKQLPAFPIKIRLGFELQSQRYEGAYFLSDGVKYGHVFNCRDGTINYNGWIVGRLINPCSILCLRSDWLNIQGFHCKRL